MKEVLLVIELARAFFIIKMKAKIKFKESEEEMQEFLALQVQKDLEMKLIAELQEKLQLLELEKKVAEEEEVKRVEEVEDQAGIVHEYGVEVETAYSKDKGAYQVEQPYEKNDGNQTGYEGGKNVSK